MLEYYAMRSRFLLLIALFCAASRLDAQEKTPVPTTMTECEGINNCATWTFLGGQGNGQWPSGNIGNLTIERSDSASVVIKRSDSTGASAGLTATYNGTRSGDEIGGDYTSSWPGHWEKKTGKWYAIIGRPAQSPPQVLRNCNIPGFRYCWTYTWNNAHYEGVADTGETANMDVVTFTPESVVFKGIGTGRNAGYTFTLSGKISAQGNRIVEGDSTDSNGAKGKFTMAWGTALGDLPKSTRPSVVLVPVRAVPVCLPFFFTLICD